MRTCSRVGCATSATASAVLRYDERAVHLVDMVPDPDPGQVDLCTDHAARLTPPMGWVLTDLRAASAVSA